MKKKLSKEFVIGLSVIVAILILIFGIDYLKGVNLFKPANFYEVYYTDVTDLGISSPVTINGYKVGQVRDISIDYTKPGKIKVTLALNKHLKLPEGTVAQMGHTLLSGAFINLQMGNSSNILKVGSTLDGNVAPDLMTSVQEQIMPAVGNIMPKVDSLLYNINLIAGNPALHNSINRFDGITANLYSTTAGLNSTMGVVNTRVPVILNGAGRAVVNIDTIAQNLAILSADLKELPLKPTMENVERITTNLEAFSRQLNDPNSTIGKLANDPALYDQLHKVSADIDSLIIDIKKNPKRYISIKLL